MLWKSIVCSLGLLMFTLQGCGGGKAVVRQDFTALAGPITVVRYWDGAFFKYTHKGQALGFMLPAFGAWGMPRMSGNNIKAECALPDFGALVMERFVERASAELPQWPEMTVLPDPKDDGYIADQGLTVVIMVSRQWMGPYRFQDVGYVVDAGMDIRQPDGTVVYSRWFTHDPTANNMNRPLEVLEAEGCKQLKEDMAFAADRTVDDFISCLKDQACN